jgi:hypothetical protein
VANLLTTSGWAAIHSGDAGVFEQLKKQVALYKQIIGTEAWNDYQHRLNQLREATRYAVERGGYDKNGRRHDDEQRAVLFMLDQLLGYLPAINEQYENIVANMRSDESKANSSLYGGDQLMGSLTSDI